MPRPVIRPDFNALWNMLVDVATRCGNDRVKATLVNHQGRKEYICRKLGVVSFNDVTRIEAGLRKPSRRLRP